MNLSTLQPEHPGERDAVMLFSQGYGLKGAVVGTNTIRLRSPNSPWIVYEWNMDTHWVQKINGKYKSNMGKFEDEDLAIYITRSDWSWYRPNPNTIII